MELNQWIALGGGASATVGSIWFVVVLVMRLQRSVMNAYVTEIARLHTRADKQEQDHEELKDEHDTLRKDLNDCNAERSHLRALVRHHGLDPDDWSKS